MGLIKSRSILEFNLLCSKVCFKSYTQQMTTQEEECHKKCMNNMYSSLIYCERKINEQNLLN